MITAEISAGVAVNGAALCLACSSSGAAQLMEWAGWCVSAQAQCTGAGTPGEEGVLGAGSCRQFPGWAEMGLRKLGGSPSAYPAAKSDTLPGQVGHLQAAHAGRSLRATLPVKDMECLELPRVPELLGQGWAGEILSICPFSQAESSV